MKDRSRSRALFVLHGLLCAGLLLFCTACSGRGETVETAFAQPVPTEEPEIVEFKEETTPVPTALPAPSAPPTNVPVITPTPEPGLPKDAFTLVWTSDTQHYSELHPEYLTAMTQWTAEHREEYNIQAFIHTGDMVNRAASTRQWANIDAALDLLGDIPFLALAGNHDVGTDSIDYCYFLKHVAVRYPDVSSFYQNGRGAYVELAMQPQSFLLIGTGWGYKDAAVAWLNQTIAKYPNHIVVLAVHSYLNTAGTFTDGGDILFEQVVKKNRNVYIVLAGHRDDIAFRTDGIDDDSDGAFDRTVYAQMYNYQEVKENGGGGYMRLLTVDPNARTMEVKTYSPYFDDWKTGEQEQFTIENLY